MTSKDLSAQRLTLEQLCQQNAIGWNSADNAQQLAITLAEAIEAKLEHAIQTQGKASLVVSGGSTPAPVFAQLSQSNLDWSAVTITLADERWVPANHEDSNELLVRQALLIDQAAAATFIPLYRDGLSQQQALKAVEHSISSMASPFTVVILGMGGDGHTASLFPDAPAEQLQQAMQLDNTAAVAMLNPPSVPQMRISLTRAALLNAQCRIVHITGNSKYQVLESALFETLSEQPEPHTGQSVVKPALGAYSSGHKPIVGLISEQPELVDVYWSP